MVFHFCGKQFYDASAKAARILNPRSPVQHARFFRIEVDCDRVSIEATDHNNVLKAWHEHPNEETGSFYVGAADFLQALKGLSTGDASCAVMAGLVAISQDRFSITLPKIENDCWSTVDVPESPASFEFSGDWYRSQGKTVRAAAAKCHFESRAVMTGICFDLSPAPSLSALVATDGRRMTFCPLDAAPEQGLRAVLPPEPAKALHFLSRGEVVAAEMSEREYAFRAANWSLRGRLTEGRFPDYLKVVPESGNYKAAAANICRKGLIKAIDHLLAFCTDQRSPYLLRFKFDLKESIMGTYNYKDNGDIEAQYRLDAVYHGQPMEIGFNGKYLLEFLKLASGEHITISLQDPARSALVYGDDGTKYVLMPVKLRNLLRDEAA